MFSTDSPTRCCSALRRPISSSMRGRRCRSRRISFNALRDIVALDGPHPFRFPRLLLAALVGLGEHLHDFILELL